MRELNSIKNGKVVGHAIDITRPFQNAVVPTVGFLLSTLTLPFFKTRWIKFQKYPQFPLDESQKI